MLKLLEVVHPVDLTGSDIEAAVRLGWDDFEDCLIALSASKAGAEYLITRDAKGFSRSPVPPVSPQGWLDLMQEQEGVTFASVEF